MGKGNEAKRAGAPWPSRSPASLPFSPQSRASQRKSSSERLKLSRLTDGAVFASGGTKFFGGGTIPSRVPSASKTVRPPLEGRRTCSPLRRTPKRQSPPPPTPKRPRPPPKSHLLNGYDFEERTRRKGLPR